MFGLTYSQDLVFSAQATNVSKSTKYQTTCCWAQLFNTLVTQFHDASFNLLEASQLPFLFLFSDRPCCLDCHGALLLAANRQYPLCFCNFQSHWMLQIPSALMRRDYSQISYGVCRQCPTHKLKRRHHIAFSLPSRNSSPACKDLNYFLSSDDGF